MMQCVCRQCGWVYEDHKGMGVHRSPIYCPICDGRMIIKPKEEKEKE